MRRFLSALLTFLVVIAGVSAVTAAVVVPLWLFATRAHRDYSIFVAALTLTGIVAVVVRSVRRRPRREASRRQSVRRRSARHSLVLRRSTRQNSRPTDRDQADSDGARASDRTVD